jgi:hypothetical protein
MPNGLYAQTADKTQHREISTPLFAGDVQTKAGATVVAVHYAVVPMPTKGEVSFYTRFSSALKVRNTITDAAGKTLATWSSEGAQEQCFTNISENFFKQEPVTGYTWRIATEQGAELTIIRFTAKDALGK